MFREMEGARRRAGRRPRGLGPPLPGRLQPVHDRGLGRLHPDHDRRLVHHAVLYTLAPVVQPAHHLAEVVDPRSGDGRVRQGVIPGTHQHLDGQAARGERAVQAQRRVRIPVAPAADQERRARDRCSVAHGSVAPVRAVHLVLQPLEQVRLVVGDVALPDGRPVTGRGLGVRGHRVPRDHPRPVPADVVVHAEQAAAVVAVVRVAIVGEVDRDDRGEVGRPVRRDLERGEAAVGDPDHVHVAVAPRLRGEPFDRLGAVRLLLECVLVGVDALRGASAADVHPGDDVAMSREVEVVVRDRRIDLVLAVRDVVHHDGKRRRGREVIAAVVRDIEVRREPHAVGHGDVDVLDQHHTRGGTPDDRRRQHVDAAHAWSPSACPARSAPVRASECARISGAVRGRGRRNGWSPRM